MEKTCSGLTVLQIQADWNYKLTLASSTLLIRQQKPSCQTAKSKMAWEKSNTEQLKRQSNCCLRLIDCLNVFRSWQCWQCLSYLNTFLLVWGSLAETKKTSGSFVCYQALLFGDWEFFCFVNSCSATGPLRFRACNHAHSFCQARIEYFLLLALAWPN